MRANEFVNENLRKWFKEKWVRFGPDGKIRGACARGDDSEGKPKCLPQAKAHALGKKGRKYAASKKRREDPNPERRGPAKNVATKKKTNEAEGQGPRIRKYTYERPDGSIATRYEVLDSQGRRVPGQGTEGFDDLENAKQFLNRLKSSLEETQLDELKCWPNYTRVKGVPAGEPGSCKKKTKEDVAEEKCPHCGGAMFSELMINEKKDACYYKVKSRYKVWPSAYASGALVKCRKKGAKNWGTGGKKNEGVEEGTDQEFPTGGSKGLPMPGTYEQESDMFKRHGTRRITAMTNEEQLDEKWSEKYKRSINCSNPKGFSQRAHCQGRKKHK